MGTRGADRIDRDCPTGRSAAGYDVLSHAYVRGVWTLGLTISARYPDGALSKRSIRICLPLFLSSLMASRNKTEAPRRQ